MKWGRVRNYKSIRVRQNLIEVRLKIAETIAEGSGIPYSLLFYNKGLSKEGIERLNELADSYNNTICNAVKKLPRKLKKKYKRKFIV